LAAGKASQFDVPALAWPQLTSGAFYESDRQERSQPQLAAMHASWRSALWLNSPAPVSAFGHADSSCSALVARSIRGPLERWKRLCSPCERWFYLRLGRAGLTLLLVLRGCLWLCSCLGVTLCRAIRPKLRLSLAPGSGTLRAVASALRPSALPRPPVRSTAPSAWLDQSALLVSRDAGRRPRTFGPG
jgi:hypothetical protein